MPVLPYINIHTHHLNDYSNVCIVLSINPGEQITNREAVFYSVGIHPWDSNLTDVPSAIHELEISASDSNVIAIGETGLDRMIETPLSIQEDVFQKQLQIAEKYNKPVIIHCVKCFSELISIRKKKSIKLPWIVHDFRKNIQIAEDLIALGCYLSFGKALLTDEKLQTVFRSLPMNKLFLETDDSDIKIEELYKKASLVKGLNLEDLKEELFSNFTTCFNRI
ncbi:hydrolase TatD [Labilibaculum antarcticum]|uniref:Hydrolase TatD n=1 Tax=Labilibaculum antarcticum TaxID=1717717 RepID=A0A1Y1CEA6_9BACT|nr:hydrolase TatD [Labilibaculum antarcticum]